ncbi:hypothetical protein T265_06874 [Opisthorchis viverrini]|uniref:Uncharacterized protein n=1 Tax=Opisthorchis viverrini TaxID=6198 RepID=A0A074ZEL0_OPIVI|nr:hypothetical protein T265_06874 [Opisthorchis viverrini]KER25701.1 hypothetical protein T265_06874 [Opisthorchis viverrini]
MSPRLVMKRLQSNCPAQRTSQRPPATLPELPTFSSIENLEILRSKERIGFVILVHHLHKGKQMCKPTSVFTFVGSTSSQVCHWPAQCNVDAGTPNGSERYDGPVAWVAVVPSDDTRATGLVKPRMHNDQ